MALSSVDQSISQLLINCSLLVPSNQRKYVWNQNNWLELIDDLQLVVDQQIEEHFIGSIVLKTEEINDGIRNHYSIIDGQQRVLTLTVLISAIAYLYAENKQYSLFGGLDKYLIVKTRNDEERPIVSKEANEGVFKLVNSLISATNIAKQKDQGISSPEEICRQCSLKGLIRDCFLFFVKELRKRSAGDIELLNTYMEVVEDVRYIDVKATTTEDAYSIFEVLNARGQALSDFDLLRNFVLKYCKSDDKAQQIEKINEIELMLAEKVETFLKHYVMHKYGRKSDKKDGRPYKIIVSYEKKNDINHFLDDLYLKAHYYNRIISCEECNRIEKKVFSFFKKRNQQQFRPIILGLMHQLDEGNIDQDNYNEMIMYLYWFFICFNVIGEQLSNKIEDLVQGYSKKIENEFDDVLLSKIKKSMGERLPNETNFVNAFKNLAYSNCCKGYSGSRCKTKVFAVLEYYEQIKNPRCNIEQDEFTIEHVLPDSQSQDNIYIGNLFLLEKSLNEKCGAKPIIDKIPFYKESCLVVPKHVADEIESSGFNMNDRATNMAKEIYDSFSEMCL